VPGLRPSRPRTTWGRAYEASIEAVISVVLAMLGGYYADRYFGTEPVLMFIGLVLGGVAAVRRLLKIGPGTPAGPQTMEGRDDAARPEARSEGSVSTVRERGDDGERNG